MTWDPTWETIFHARDWGRYPPEELVRFIMRNYGEVANRSQVRVLEVGCGTGANLWFMAREGFDVWGIDGSHAAIARAQGRREAERVSYRLTRLDALELAGLFKEASVDAVIDVCCLQHNRRADIQAIVNQMHAVLKPGGRLFSMMVQAGSWGDGTGTRVEPGTYTDIPEGPAAGVGLTRFSTYREVVEHFSEFGDLSIEYSGRTMHGMTRYWAHWVVEGVKA